LKSSPRRRAKSTPSVKLDVVVTARARGRAGVVGVRDGALLIRVAAPAVEGRANDELIKTVAAFLGVAKSEVVITRGAASRRKSLLVAGLTPEFLAAALARAPGDSR
jgi:uncharacterized protein (TIGR00251 family)